MPYVIANHDELDQVTDEPLFWSNREGWAPLVCAAVYASTKGWRLPLGRSYWIRLPRALARKALTHGNKKRRG